MKDRINLWTPNDPDGYGAFDEEQLYERAEDAIIELYEEPIHSCGATKRELKHHHFLCPKCGEPI